MQKKIYRTITDWFLFKDIIHVQLLSHNTFTTKFFTCSIKP